MFLQIDINKGCGGKKKGRSRKRHVTKPSRRTHSMKKIFIKFRLDILQPICYALNKKEVQNMYHIVVINGSGGKGKDTFAKNCLKLAFSHEINPHTENDILASLRIMCNVDSVNLVKSLATMAGWDGNKTEKNRKFLSDLKDLLSNWNDVPYKETIKNINTAIKNINDFNNGDGLIFVHSREPKEIQRYVNYFGSNICHTLLIKNPNVPTVVSNHADKDVENYRYDVVVYNNKDRESLEDKAKLFYHHLFEQQIGKYIYD